MDKSVEMSKVVQESSVIARCYTVTLPLKTVSEANGRDHWAQKARRARSQRLAARALVWQHPMTARAVEAAMSGQSGAVVVTLARVAPGTLDDDNLRPALKAVRDGVADALGVDDRHPAIRWQYAQHRAGRGQWAVAVQIEIAPR